MARGDIYIVGRDPTKGHEQQGTRPVLVISPGPLNRLTGMPVVLPITQGGNKHGRQPVPQSTSR